MLERSSLSPIGTPRPQRLSRPRHRTGAARPFTRLRYLAGRHQTAWRLLSAGIAVAIAVALSPPGASQSNAPTTAATATIDGVAQTEETVRQTAPGPGLVGVALPRAAGFPEIDSGSMVHAVAVNDPLISGEVRETTIVVRNARVLTVDDTAVTIEVTEADALALVEANTTGAVVLVSVGDG